MDHTIHRYGAWGVWVSIQDFCLDCMYTHRGYSEDYAGHIRRVIRGCWYLRALHRMRTLEESKQSHRALFTGVGVTKLFLLP